MIVKINAHTTHKKLRAPSEIWVMEPCSQPSATRRTLCVPEAANPTQVSAIHKIPAPPANANACQFPHGKYEANRHTLAGRATYA